VLNKNFKKEDIIKNLKIKSGFSSNFSKKLINDLIDIIIKELQLEYFNLKGIGSFKKIKKRERIGRNPKTKEEFLISSRKTLTFIPSKKLLKKINK
tara:strand:- start:739 stop:1026 length:288 start_codon:yes stop_codon:yes gene_type:complete